MRVRPVLIGAVPSVLGALPYGHDEFGSPKALLLFKDKRLLANYDKRIAAFALQFQKKDWDALSETKPVSYGFLCRHYQLCLSKDR